MSAADMELEALVGRVDGAVGEAMAADRRRWVEAAVQALALAERTPTPFNINSFRSAYVQSKRRVPNVDETNPSLRRAFAYLKPPEKEVEALMEQIDEAVAEGMAQRRPPRRPNDRMTRDPRGWAYAAGAVWERVKDNLTRPNAQLFVNAVHQAVKYDPQFFAKYPRARQQYDRALRALTDVN
jgi:hypothetical protein